LLVNGYTTYEDEKIGMLHWRSLAFKSTKALWFYVITTQPYNHSRIQMFHRKNKHNDMRFHLFRDLVKKRIVKLSCCKSHIQVVDITIKPLKLDQFLKAILLLFILF